MNSIKYRAYFATKNRSRRDRSSKGIWLPQLSPDCAVTGRDPQHALHVDSGRFMLGTNFAYDWPRSQGFSGTAGHGSPRPYGDGPGTAARARFRPFARPSANAGSLRIAGR
jgi:hypothetical protein